MCDLQWVISIQSFHMMNTTFIKEFCAICVQTNEKMLFHINGPDSMGLSNHEMIIFREQVNKHGLDFHYGDYTARQFRIKVRKYISILSDLYVVNLHTRRWLVSIGYESSNIMIIPQILRWSQLKSCPEMRCDAHKENKYDCAQERCAEILNYLRPAMVPYLNLDLIKKCKKPTSDLMLYNEQLTLQEPDFQKLCDVDLIDQYYPKPPVHVPSGHCERSLERDGMQALQIA